MEALTVLHLVAYALASVLYLAFHVGFRAPLARAGRAALAAGFAVQLVDIAVRCLRGDHPAASTAEAMAFVAWLVAGGYLVASLRYRLWAAGAFAAPAALTLLLLARVVPVAEPHARSGTLGLSHILLATVGVATFALAAALAVVYLVQERRLKRGQVVRQLRAGGAPLDTLDRLAARCVSFGFLVFTLAIVTGALWVARLGLLRGGQWRPEHVLAVASWLAFGVLVVARAGAGWQGRRAAWLTVGGFSGVVLVLVGYLVRSAV